MSVDRWFLLREMVKRDFQSRYAGSLLGVVWSVLQPLWQLVLFTFVFSTVLRFRLVGEATESFALFLFAGLVPWIAVQEGVSRATTAITDNAGLVKKLRFPPELLIYTSVIGGLIQSALAAAVLVVMLLLQGQGSLEGTPWLLLALPLQVTLTVGLGLGLAAVHVYFRDTSQAVGFLTMTWFYLTPIVYPFSGIPEKLQTFVSANPLTGLVELYRAVFLGGEVDNVLGLSLLGALALVSVLVGSFLFRSLKPGFVEEM